jgi:peptidylprolyl isomerase
MPRHSRALVVALVASGASALAACSSSPTASTGAGSTTTTHQASPGSAATAPGGDALIGIRPIPLADRSAPGVSGISPSVTVPVGPPPTELESADLIVGKGPLAVTGDHLKVQYVLATYSTGHVIDSSWTSQPFTFTLGAKNTVIAGWNKGLVGMRVGGRRELIIPPSLGYKDQSPGPGIAPNDTLVYVVDLLKAN